MNSIPIDEIFLHIFVMVDDWYQAQASELRKGQPGKRPDFSDSEMMTNCNESYINFFSEYP